MTDLEQPNTLFSEGSFIPFMDTAHFCDFWLFFGITIWGTTASDMKLRNVPINHPQ